jgi:hypothetical protein
MSMLKRLGNPRLLMPAIGVAAVLLGSLLAQNWLKDGKLARSDYVGTIDVSAEDAKQYRPVPFEWHVASRAGLFNGRDSAFVRIDVSGESPVLCGWLLTDKAGASVRATRWLSEARLKVGDLKVGAQFVAPTEKTPGDGLNAGCARLDGNTRPAANAPLSLEGPPVQE